MAKGSSMRGLFGKYVVFLADPVEEISDCFVLRPVTDPVAREVLTLYADMTPNDVLREDLHEWLDGIPEEEA